MAFRRSAARKRLVCAVQDMIDIGIEQEACKVGRHTCDFAAKVSFQMLKELIHVGLWPITSLPDEPQELLARFDAIDFKFYALASCDLKGTRSAPCVHEAKVHEEWRASVSQEIKKVCRGICISCAREDDVPRCEHGEDREGCPRRMEESVED